MKIIDELKGKDVIDDSGDKIDEIKDVEWNPEINRVESVLLSGGRVSSKVGLGEKKVVDFDMINSIGDKILLSGIHFERM